MIFECSILPGYRSAEIEADTEEEAKRQFVQLIRDGLEEQHVDVDLIEE